jgi:protein-tyrosine phosphatase
VNQPADALAQEIARAHGLDLSPHLGQQVEKAILEKHELILVMEGHHRDYLRSRFPQVSGKVFLLGKWEEDMPIPDPYKKSPEFFEEVYNQIDRSVSRWVNRIHGAH